MIRYARHFSILILLTMIMSACAARTAAPENGDEAAQPARVTVMNRSTNHMTIYVARGAERIRLGGISPGGQETWEIPSHLIIGVSRLQFTAEPPGQRGPVASTVHNVSAGSHVEMIVR